LHRERRNERIFHFSSAIYRISLALIRVISWIVPWAEKRKTMHEVTRTDTKHNYKIQSYVR